MPPVRVLLIHGETLGCAGAQKVLAYCLSATPDQDLHTTLLLAPNPALSQLLPPHTPTLPLIANQRFSLPQLFRQALAIRKLLQSQSFDILHGWTARDWELTSLAGWLTRRPTVGSLHEHPQAPHISHARRRLMLASARFGLHRVLCVSQAVAMACQTQHFPKRRLRVVPNGIPARPQVSPPHPGPRTRLGFLGLLDPSKGLDVLLQLLDFADPEVGDTWELRVAGSPLDDAGNRWLHQLQATYQSRPWWPRVSWLGQIRHVAAFLDDLDLLMVPSTAFDAFPTVLLEAAEAARPAFAHRIGGVPEIVEHGVTGWLYDHDQPAATRQLLIHLLREPSLLTAAGAAAAQRVRQRFSPAAMARGYADLYLDLLQPLHPLPS